MTTERPSRYLPWVFLGLSLLLTMLLSWRMETSLDTGFHLSTGRWILENGKLPDKDAFTYTVPDHDYLDMSSLFQLFCALADAAGGDVGVGILRLLLIAGTVALLFVRSWLRGVRSAPLLGFGMLLGIVAFELRFMIRPEILSYLFLSLELHFLERHAQDGRPRWLYLIVPLQLVWSYSHAFCLFGPAVLGLYALCGLLPVRTRRDRHPWFALLGTGLALCLNPYGLRGVWFLLGLGREMQEENLFGGSISELSSPFADGPNLWPIVALLVLLVSTSIVIVLRWRALRPCDIGLTAAFGALACVAVRNIPLFVLTALPVMLQAASTLLEGAAQRRRGRWLRSRAVAVGARLAAAVCLLFLSSQVILGGYYLADRRPERFGYGPAESVYPVGTVELFAESRVGGPVYNHLNFGGYLIGRLWPQEKVFIDGRLEVMGEEFYQESLRINAGPGWPDMMRRFDPNVVLIPHTFPRLLNRLFRDPEWRLWELDSVAALFVRSRPGNATALADAERRWTQLRRQAAADTEPLQPRRSGGVLVRWFGLRHFPWEAYGRANALYGIGLYAEARTEYRRALREADRDYPQLAGNLAAACYHLGRNDEALLWYRRVMELDSSYPKARERIAQLTR